MKEGCPLRPARRRYRQFESWLSAWPHDHCCNLGGAHDQQHHHHPSLSTTLGAFPAFSANFKTHINGIKLFFGKPFVAGWRSLGGKSTAAKNILKNINHNRMTGSQKVTISANCTSVYVIQYPSQMRPSFKERRQTLTRSLDLV